MKLLFAEDDRDISKAVTTVLQGQRKKLAALHAPVEIHTVRGVGYKLEETQCSGN